MKVMRRWRRGGFGWLLAAAGPRAPNNGSSGILLGVPPSRFQSPLLLCCMIICKWTCEAETRGGCRSHRCYRQRHSKAVPEPRAPGRNSSCCDSRLTSGRKRPTTVGFFFALGHSTVVVIVCRAWCRSRDHVLAPAICAIPVSLSTLPLVTRCALLALPNHGIREAVRPPQRCRSTLS